MKRIKYTILLGFLMTLSSCNSQKTNREIEDEFVKKYAPADMDSYGFTLAVDSKVPEVHQLLNDLEANFYFYGDKTEFEQKAAKIQKLDPNYPSGILMGAFYVTDPEEYKSLVTKAYKLSKNSTLKSERDIIQAEYSLLVEEDYLKAQKYFQKVVDMYPDSAAAIWSLGMAYYYNDEYDKALECYEKSTKLIPNLPKGYEFMSIMYLMKGENEKALDYLEIAKKYGAKTENDIYFAEYEHLLYYKNGLYEKTMKSIKKAYTYGDYYKNSKSLKDTYLAAQAKYDSIQSLQH